MESYNFESVTRLKYLIAFITSDNVISEEIKPMMRSGNICYLVLKNLFQSKLVSRASKVRVCETVIKPTISYACEIWTLTKHNEILLERFERKILKRI